MMGILNGIVTLIALVTFIAIIFWAFSKGRAKANKEASMLPFDLPDEGVSQEGKKQQGARKNEGGSHE